VYRVNPDSHLFFYSQAAVARRTLNPSAEIVDPLTGDRILLPPNTADSFINEHFTADEWRMFKSPRGLKRFLRSRLALWVALVAGLVAVMVFSGVEALTTLGCLLLSALFVIIPWDAVGQNRKNFASFINQFF